MLEVNKWLQQFSTPWLDRVAEVITMLGEETFFIAILCWLMWTTSKRLRYTVAFSYVSSIMLNSALKEIFHIARPFHQEGIQSLRIETAEGYSFPSGHTQGTATFWTALALRLKNNKVTAFAIVLSLLVATSRLYLGVHTIADVTAGLAIGFLWSGFIYYTFNQEKQHHHRIMWAIGLFAIVAMIYYPETMLYKSAGLTFSFIFGYMLLDRFIKEYELTLGQKVVVYVIGLVLVLAIKAGTKSLLPLSLYSDFARYFAIGLFASTIYPLVVQNVLKK